MSLWQERYDRLVKQAFGPTARLDGSFGTTARPGSIEIVLDGQQIGSGRTFEQAMQAASRQLSQGR